MEKSISPLDGRYGARLQHLGDYFSEYALMRMRCMVELQYIEALNATDLFPKLTDSELERIHRVKHKFSDEDYAGIKAIEAKINHDVKACEVYLREKLQLENNNLVHFGLTSEDVNNLSYTLLIKDFMDQEQFTVIEQLLAALSVKVQAWKNIPFPARTHGQKASPTTAGKELAIPMFRILRQFKRMKKMNFLGKLNGATGNFSALLAAFPDYDWLYFSCNFIERLGMLPNIATTQIEDHDSWAEYFSIVRQINNIILDLDRDLWMYMTLGYFTVEPEREAVGSSTMPHKVNPINFENSEGNLEVSNALLDMLINKLSMSRMQRDLSDSTVTRNIGVALAHSYLAFQETIKGVEKLRLIEDLCLEELDKSPELLAEPIQTILKLEKFDDPYTMLKDFTRGKKITYEDILNFINELDVNEQVKEKLRDLRVRDYTGYAAYLCDIILEDVKSELLKGEM